MTPGWALLAGALVAAGLVALVAGLRRSTPGLRAALDRVGGAGPETETFEDPAALGSPSERWGAFLQRHVPIPLSGAQRRALRLQDKSVAELYADKTVMAVIGTVLPALLGSAGSWVLTGQVGVVPALAAVVGGVAGFFVPDLLLLRSGAGTRTAALEALLVFVDLVTLERLANASAPQALLRAASLSQVALFVQIRTALERASLEQQSPYAELRRLAETLDLPELADVADVMQLDETGAALSGTLRARVRELRDAHLTAEQIRASADAEGMTIYMTLPAMAFGLILLTAALLQIVLG
ncbi:type II secretion system F family protein [Microlunatus antarcticus]